MAIDKIYEDVQLYFDFNKEITGSTKLADSVLYSNLDPTGATNMAVEMAKIYSWVNDVFTFTPAGTKKITINSSVLPEDSDTTYSFREGTTDGAFQVQENDDAWQTIAIHNVATLASDGLVKESQLPKYRVIKVDNPQVSGTADRFKLQICRNWSAAAASQTWVDVSDINLGLFATTASGNDEIGKIKSALLPSYVDDIVEGYYYNNAWYSDSAHTSRVYGQSDKIYVDLSTDKSYRCSPTGTPGESGYSETWVDISNPLSAEEIYALCGMPTGGNFNSTKHGLVPAASASGDSNRFLRGDGTWADIPAAITYALSGTTYGTSNATQIVTLTPSSGNKTTAEIKALVGATSSAAGKAGLVPVPPSSGYNTKYLRADGTWVVPPNTTYALSGAYGSGNKTWVSTLTANGSTAAGTSTVPTASTSVYGITSLSSATNSSAEDVAATPKAVKSAYDLAAGKSTVTYTRSVSSGTLLGTLSINGSTTNNGIYAPNFSASSSSAAGTRGLVQAPANSMDKYLRGDNTWVEPVEDFRTKVNNETYTLVLHCTNGRT